MITLAKSYLNPPPFSQHTVTQLALPERLVLPQADAVDAAAVGSSATIGGGANSRRGSTDSAAGQMQQLLATGAACGVTYLMTMETDALTGPVAVRKAVGQLLRGGAAGRQPAPLLVHFKVSLCSSWNKTPRSYI